MASLITMKANEGRKVGNRGTIREHVPAAAGHLRASQRPHQAFEFLQYHFHF